MPYLTKRPCTNAESGMRTSSSIPEAAASMARCSFAWCSARSPYELAPRDRKEREKKQEPRHGHAALRENESETNGISPEDDVFTKLAHFPEISPVAEKQAKKKNGIEGRNTHKYKIIRAPQYQYATGWYRVVSCGMPPCHPRISCNQTITGDIS